MELLIYSQIVKLSVEYLQFNKITNLGYVNKFKQDSIYISIVLETNLDFESIRRHLCADDNSCYKRENLKHKCLSNYGIDSDKYIDEKYFDNDYITSVQFICNNITYKKMMDKNLFNVYFINDGMDIELKKFINSSRYSIGYFIAQKIKNEYYPFKPVLTFQLNNVSYDQDNNFVSIKLFFLVVIIFTFIQQYKIVQLKIAMNFEYYLKCNLNKSS